MTIFFTLSLILSILSGQLLKIPLIFFNGISSLDLTIIFLDFILFLKVSTKPENFYAFLSILTQKKSILLAIFFLGIATVSLIFTPLHLQLFEIIFSSLYILRLIFYMMLAALLSLTIFKDLKKSIPAVLVTSGIALALLGILQIIFIPNIQFLENYGWDPHRFRVVSTFLDPNFLGAYFVLTLLILIHKIQTPKYFQKNWLLFGVVFAGLLLTFSRSSILMFFVSFLVMSLLKKSLTLFIFTILLTLFLYGSFRIYNIDFETSQNIDRTKSAQSRLLTWQVGQMIFEKNPLLGIGFNSYRYALRGYNLTPNSALSSRAASGNDSSLLFVLATTGIIGLLTFLAYLYSMIHSAIKTYKTNFISVLFLAGMAGLLIHSLFNNSLFYPPLLIWWLLMAVT